jgi:hypothetical protein
LRVAHIYDESEHGAGTGAPRHTAAFPKWPFGVKVANMHDESEHRTRTRAPRHSTPDSVNPHLGLSTAPGPLKLKLFWELVVYY